MREVAAQCSNRCFGLIAAPGLIKRVRLPVQGRVGTSALNGRYVGKSVNSLLPLVLIEIVSAVFIELLFAAIGWCTLVAEKIAHNWPSDVCSLRETELTEKNNDKHEFECVFHMIGV